MIDPLAQKVARKFVGQEHSSLVERVAQSYNNALARSSKFSAEAVAAEEAAKKAPKLKLDMTKLEDLIVKLPFAVKVLDQKRGDKGSEREVSRLMGEYTNYVSDLRKALDTALPSDAAKERQKGDELLHRIDFFHYGRGIDAALLSGRLPSAQFNEEFHKVKPIFHELHQLLKGQQVLLASADPGLADQEGAKGQARFDENKRHHAEMQGLIKKVENADPSAKKKFDAAYSKMFENGEKAAQAAKKLLAHYDGDENAEDALHMLERTLHAWENNKMDHHKAQGAFAGAKMRQGTETYAHAQDLESYVKDLHKFLKDPNAHVDDSWRR
jgi:hypothetical protein